MDIPRSREAEAFLADIADAPQSQVSACQGWTAHEIAAHVTGIHIEVIRHLDPYMQGEQVPKTRGFEEREAPLQALNHEELLSRLERAEHDMRRLVADVLDNEPDASIPWTGRTMAVETFVPHLRNEHALHRWDVVGGDDVSDELLGDDDLLRHSVSELGRILLAAGRRHDPRPDDDFAVELRTPGQAPLHVSVDAGTAALTWAPPPSASEAAVVELTPAARHLFIWGRRPDRHDQVRSHLPAADLTRLQALLAGY